MVGLIKFVMLIFVDIGENTLTKNVFPGGSKTFSFKKPSENCPTVITYRTYGYLQCKDWYAILL